MEYFSISRKYKTDLLEKPDPLEDNKLKHIYALKPSGRLLEIGCSVDNFLHKVHKRFLGELGLKPEYGHCYAAPDPLRSTRLGGSAAHNIHGVLKADELLYINTLNADSYATARLTIYMVTPS